LFIPFETAEKWFRRVSKIFSAEKTTIFRSVNVIFENAENI